MELAEIRPSTHRLRLSHSLSRQKILSREEEREEEEAHLRAEHSQDESNVNSPVANMMECHVDQAGSTMSATYVDSSIYRRVPRASSNVHNQHVSYESQHWQHPWARSPSVSSLSNSSSGSDLDTGGVAMMSKLSAKSSPMGSDPGSDCSMTRSMNNYDFNQTDSEACSARTFTGGEMETDEGMPKLSVSATPTALELSEVFMWVDENNDGLICGADLRGFMSRVLAFEISESEAEALLLVYGNGRTLRIDTSPGGRQSNGGGAVVDFEGFLALYQCLCGEPVTPEEQSMMAVAFQVFDQTQLQSGRWVE